MRAGILAAAVALALLTTAPAEALPLPLEPLATQATDTGPGADGVVQPGDTVSIEQGFVSSYLGTLTGLTGTLSATNGTATVLNGTSAYSDVGFGATTLDTVPFTAHLPTSLACGENATFDLNVGGPDGSSSWAVRVPTGAAGDTQTVPSGDVPHSIPSPGILSSAVDVATAGRVKSVRVLVGSLVHPYDGDLKLTLVSPSGTRVVLADHRGGSGANFTNTTFGADGPAIAGGSAPFIGTYAADGDLHTLEGEPMQGTWKLEVEDGSTPDAGQLEAWSLEVTAASCAATPHAAFSASPQPASPGQDVTLDASASTDPVGTITDYAWDLDGNGSYETDGGASPTLHRTFATRGSYPVGLRITDSGGLTDTATQTVLVTSPPTAAFTVSPAAPTTGQDVTLDASGSTDADGTVVRYMWDLDGNGSFETDGGTSAVRHTTFATPGTHTVRLRVTDDTGATAVVAHDVVATNRPPTAAIAAPSVATVGTPVTLDASGSSDPDGTVSAYAWDLDGNGTYETPGTPDGRVQTTWATTGTKTVGVQVTDDQGATATTTATIPVTHAPTAVLQATPTTARPRQSVSFDATGSSDPDGPLARVQWDFDGNGTWDADTGTTLQTTHSYTSTGSFTARVRVTDADGATATASAPVAVVNLAPVAALSARPNPAAPGAPVTLDASASHDPDGTIVRYAWDLDGNGSYETDGGSAPTVTHVYPNPVVVAVGVRVTDDDGATATAQFPLAVVDPAGGGGGGAGGGGGGGTGATGGGTGGTGGTGTPTGTPGGGGGGTGPGGTGTGAGGGTAGTASGPLSVALLGPPIQPLKAVLRTGLTVACHADRPAACVLTAEVPPADAKRLRLARASRGRPKAYRIGTLTLRADAGRDGTGAFRLPARLRRALRRRASVLVLVRGTGLDAAGHQVTLTRALLIRR